MKLYSSSVTGLKHLVRLQRCKKAMGWCTAQCKMLLFCVKTIVKCVVTQFWTSPKKKKRKGKHFGSLATFRSGTFTMLYRATEHVIQHENTRRWTVGCYKCLQVYHFPFLRFWDIYQLYNTLCNNLYIQYVTPHIKNRPKPTVCLLWIGVDEIISEVLGDSECIFLFVDIGILDGQVAPLRLLGLGLPACSLPTCVSFADESSIECKCTIHKLSTNVYLIWSIKNMNTPQFSQVEVKFTITKNLLVWI